MRLSLHFLSDVLYWTKLSYIVSVLLSTKLMSLGSSSGIHFSSSSIQGYFRDEGTTISRGHSCLKIYATEMAWIVFPKPIWWRKWLVVSGVSGKTEFDQRKANHSYLICNHTPAKEKKKLIRHIELTVSEFSDDDLPRHQNIFKSCSK